MNLPFAPQLRTRFALINLDFVKSLARPVVLSLLIAYLGGLWLHLIHHQEGAHELVEIAPVFHWLRDSSLAWPLVFIATWSAMRLARWLAMRRRWETGRLSASLVEVMLVGLLAGIFISAGNPIHAWLFQASHQHEASFAEHLVRDGLISLPVNLLLAGLFILFWPAVSPQHSPRRRLISGAVFLFSAVLLVATLLSPVGDSLGLPELLPQKVSAQAPCVRTVTADVVALDQPFYYNRLGAIQPNGMIYALARDVVVTATGQPISELTIAQRALIAGQVSLRIDKRPRPIVLRMNEGDCLSINFTNLLDPLEFIFVLPGDFPTGPINLPNGPIGVGIPQQVNDQPLTREASIHIDGLSLFGDIGSDGSSVGQNFPGSLVAPGASTTYTYHADKEATHLMYSMGATLGADGAGGARTYGLFGAVNVQKKGAEWYRSQLTRQEMDWATPAETLLTDSNGNGVWDPAVPADTYTDTNGNGVWDPAEPLVLDQNGNGLWDLGDEFTDQNGNGVWDPAEPLLTDENGNGVWDEAIPADTFADTNGDGLWNLHRTTPGGQPILDYEAVYPAEAGGAKVGLPIIAMLNGSEIVHTDINAIITGPNKGRFPAGTYPDNLAAGDRNEPYREFTVIFHDDAFGVQAFPAFYNDPVLGHTLAGVADGFPINYGSGGIGSEIIANRLGVGPMWDCAECKYEEYFLTSFTVGDPAMIVDIPANTTDLAGNVIPGAKATKALYPDDPSNVHHAYMNDRVKFRNLHAGPKEHHIFHLHAHQWLFNPDDPQSNYLDGQAVGPGSGYTYEIAYGGSGNRNKTVGDSIFHCHFYPHFAQGMWELWRVHDTFEQGTLLTVDVPGTPENEGGFPVPGARALPDGEIVNGSPIPGLVPIPTNAMPPMPDAAATIVASDLNGDGTMDSSQFDANGDGTADIFQAGDLTAAPATNPGYPWFTPGLMGHRPPTPALDLADVNGDGIIDDGGLPRHIVTSGPDEDNLGHAGAPIEMYVSRLDFNKILHEASAIQLPEGGTAVEQVAMNFHAGPGGGDPTYDSYFPNGLPANGTNGFEVNGLPAVAGAPYAEPCRTDPNAAGNVANITQNRTIKGANIEMPVVLNKVGWHFQQQRFEALWEDVVPTLTNARAPEPMIMRLNSTDCAEFWHTNLVPNVYQLDDYQVRTPTDIIGQHIHLVKFDVMSADGSANGFNYEDGTLSPDEVRERIDAFNHGGGLTQLDGTVTTTLAPAAHPFFGPIGPTGQNWLGARTTIQRWYADPLLERSWDGGVGTVFTHDHYGPSTHQQVGLYSTLLVEPKGSVWRHNETGALLGTRTDGGPTTWQAIIQPGGGPGAAVFDAHREFYFEFADFQHAYEANGGVLGTQLNENLLGASVPIPSYADFANAINPSFRLPPPNPADIYIHPNWCPGVLGGPVIQRPCPEAISADDPGTYALNFRNEPIGLRVFNGIVGPGAGQAPGLAGDLSFAYQSRTDRAIAALNSQPGGPYPPLTADVQPGDPWTPLLRVYMGDKVRIRVQVGAHEEEHNFTIPGLKWKKETNSPNSGWKNSEFFGIDEYFNLDVPIVPDTQKTGGSVDYIYTVGAELEGMWNGVWGILRSYNSERGDLYELPNNNVARGGYDFTNQADFDGICPVTAPVKTFEVTAVRAVDVLDPVQGVVYNSRLTFLRDLPGGINGQGPLIDPTVLMYVLNQDLTFDAATGAPNGLKPGAPIEPLIIRVNAGDCVNVSLTNALPDDLSGTEMPGLDSMPPIIQKDVNVAVPGVGGILTFNKNDITPSSYVGLTPQLLAFDPKTNGGFSTGLTTGKLVAPGATDSYKWYAGDIKVKNAGISKNKTQFTLTATPVEFGAAGLMPADRIKGTENGLVGAIIVEPQNSCWIADPGTRAQATVWKGAKDAGGASLIGRCPSTPTTSTDSFRDFVTIMQNDINLRFGGTVQVLDAAGNVVQTFDCSVDPSPIQCAVPNIAAEGPLGPTEESQDSGQKAINYKSDPPWFRLGITPNFFQIIHRDAGLKDLIPRVFSNFLDIGAGPVGDPQTQIFNASPNGPHYGRMRVLMPGGHARGITYTLHGHEWNSRPYINNSTEIGDNPLSEYYGTQEGINPTGHWDFVIDLGGPFNVTGDYLWRDQAAFGNFMGLWGLIRFNETAPVVANPVLTVVKYQALDINPLTLAFDLDGLTGATVNIVGGPVFGTLTQNPDGTYKYTSTTWPACGDSFVCADSFTYNITDNTGRVSNTGTVTINVTNTAPVAVNDTVQITADGGVNVPVTILANDIDAEGDLARTPLTVTIVGVPLDQNGEPAGTATLNPDNTIQYVNDVSAFTGVVRFGYTVQDESGAISNTGIIRVAIRVDSIVITSAQFQEVNRKWTVAGTCSIPGNTITIYSGDTIEPATRGPVVGTAVCALDNTFLFSNTSTAPDPLIDQFNYVSAESTGLGFFEGFPLSFAGPNLPPVAGDDTTTTDEDVAKVIDVLANDTDANFDLLTPVIVTQPANGTVVVNPDRMVTYTPALNYNGPDSFTYQADDGKDLSNIATVNITVNAVNDAPSAVDDLYVTDVGTPLIVAAPGILDNDSDVEGNPFTLDTTPVSGPAAGNTLTINADGSFTYTPDPGNPLAVPAVPAFSGTDSFQYRICEVDANNNPTNVCGTATVTINVGVNTAPVAVNDTAQAQQTTATLTSPATGNVLANDTDADGDGLTAALKAPPANGTLTLNGNGDFSYTPNLNFVGTDSFTYVANDGVADSNVATVTITVIDRVAITSAEYRIRQGRWNVQGTVSRPASTITLYMDSVSPANLIGTANVDPISGAWNYNNTTVAQPPAGTTVIAVSSGGGVSAPRVVNIRR